MFLSLVVWVLLFAVPADAVGASGGLLGQGTSQDVLAPFLACNSPAEFIELQRGVDMARLVEGLDDWSAVRLGTLGPLISGSDVLNRKRAAFLVTATREYGPARAELFALYILHSAFTDDLHQMLRALAGNKQLGATLSRMGSVREVLRRRGLNLTDYPERSERLGDVARGLAGAANEALSTSELRRGALALKYSAQRGQLPPPYQQALDEVERAEMNAALTPGNVALGSLDSLTFGVPLGFYNLVAGTCRGVYSLSQGRYEQATRELSAAAVLVSLYAGGKGLRSFAEARGSTGVQWVRVGRLQVPELGFQGLTEVTERLFDRLGGEGMQELARYIQASREAALLVYEGGETGAVALHEARGDVTKAQAWLSRARPQLSGPSSTVVGAGKGLDGMASLADETVGLTPEVVAARLLEVELESAGPRLSGNVAMLEKQHPSVAVPPLESQGHPLWNDYVAYWEKRFAELKRGEPVKPPLAWTGYAQMQGQFARGLVFERAMVKVLRADASLPKAQRRFLKDFDEPRIETYVGVAKRNTPGVRFADVLVIENQPRSSPPRVEAFSFKSRELGGLRKNELLARMRADASEALLYYGEELDIRRRSLHLRDTPVRVRRVRLIYEGGALKPRDPQMLEQVVSVVEEDVDGVEVLFQ